MAVKGEAGNHAAVLRIEEVPDGPLLRFTILDLMGSNFNIHLVQHSLEFFPATTQLGERRYVCPAVTCDFCVQIGGICFRGETGSVHLDTKESAGGQPRAKGR